MLDEDQNHVKIINSQMKLLARLTPRKDKFHGTKVTTFAWADIKDSIMLALDQGSIVFYKLSKYLQDQS